MSDILSGQTDHNSHAPMTTAQTVAICQHLQQEIRNVESIVTELQRDMLHQTEYVQTLKSRSTDSHDDIHNLQVGIAEANARHEKMAAEHGRTCDNVVELQASSLAMQEKVVQLDEANRLSDTTMEMLQREFKQEKESLRTLAETIDKLASQDIKKLQKEAAGSKLYLDQVAEEQSKSAEFGQKTRDFLREAKAEIEGTVNEVKRANTVTSILESRLVTTSQGVQANTGKFADLNSQLSKITECYEQTKARVGESELKLKEVNDANKFTQHELEDRTREMAAMSEKVRDSLVGLEKESGSGDEMRHQINAVRGSVDQLMRKVMSMQGELKELGDTTRTVRAGLQQQSAMLLPNIALDSPAGGMGGMDFGGSPSGRGGTASSTKRPANGASPAGAW